MSKQWNNGYSRHFLILGNETPHPGLGFGELHLIHTVPMQEGLPLEHESELVADTLEQFLDGGQVTQEGNSHLETTRSNVALSGQNIVGGPLDEIRAILHPRPPRKQQREREDNA